MSNKPDAADYDPKQSFDSVQECIDKIGTYPVESWQELLIRTVAFNVAHGELGFASEIVREFEQLEVRAWQEDQKPPRAKLVPASQLQKGASDADVVLVTDRVVYLTPACTLAEDLEKLSDRFVNCTRADSRGMVTVNVALTEVWNKHIASDTMRWGRSASPVDGDRTIQNVAPHLFETEE